MELQAGKSTTTCLIAIHRREVTAVLAMKTVQLQWGYILGSLKWVEFVNWKSKRIKLFPPPPPEPAWSGLTAAASAYDDKEEGVLLLTLSSFSYLSFSLSPSSCLPPSSPSSSLLANWWCWLVSFAPSLKVYLCVLYLYIENWLTGSVKGREWKEEEEEGKWKTCIFLWMTGEYSAVHHQHLMA